MKRHETNHILNAGRPNEMGTRLNDVTRKILFIYLFI